jgi:hypothetical protein
VADITTVSISSGDVTQVNLNNNDTTTVSINSGDVTVLTGVSASINAADLSLSNSTPQEIARLGSSGTSSAASRADHIHSIANTLLDGGNF